MPLLSLLQFYRREHAALHVRIYPLHDCLRRLFPARADDDSRKNDFMKSARPIQSLLVLWALWECINAALSTFAGPLGATFVAWIPNGGWTSDLYAMSQQYGLVLFILVGVYLLIASDPVRYRAFIWIGKQIIGIAALFFLLRPAATLQRVTA